MFVDKLGEWLKGKRDTDEITPAKPITGAQICEYAKAYHHLDIQPPDVRAMINHLRRARKPIASVGQGYFWAVNHNEIRSTLEHIYQRISAMAQAADGLKYAEFGEPRLL